MSTARDSLIAAMESSDDWSAGALIDALLAVRDNEHSAPSGARAQSRTCPTCKGTGKVRNDYKAQPHVNSAMVNCRECKGSGLVESGSALVALLVERGELVRVGTTIDNDPDLGPGHLTEDLCDPSHEVVGRPEGNHETE